MPVESNFRYPSDLDATSPSAGESLVNGDDYIRGLKSVWKTTFANISGAVTATHTELNRLVGVTGTPATTSQLGLVLLSSASASNSAAIDFTSSIDSTYEEYELHIVNAVPSSGGSNLWLRSSSNSGSSFDSTSGDYLYTVSKAASTSTTVTNGSSTATSIVLGTSVNGAFGGFSGVVKLFAPSGSNTIFMWSGVHLISSASSGPERWDGIGYRGNTVNGIRLLFSSGNITSGKFKLYGVRKS